MRAYVLKVVENGTLTWQSTCNCITIFFREYTGNIQLATKATKVRVQI